MVFNVRHQQGFYIFRYFPCSHRMDTVSVKQGVCLYQGIFRKIWDLTGCIWDIYIADYTSQSAQCLDQKNSLFSCWRQIDLLFSCCQSVTSLQTFLQIFFSPVYRCQTEFPGSNCFRILQILISRHKFRQMTVPCCCDQPISAKKIHFYTIGAFKRRIHPVFTFQLITFFKMMIYIILVYRE